MEGQRWGADGPTMGPSWSRGGAAWVFFLPRVRTLRKNASGRAPMSITAAARPSPQFQGPVEQRRHLARARHEVLFWHAPPAHLAAVLEPFRHVVQRPLVQKWFHNVTDVSTHSRTHSWPTSTHKPTHPFDVHSNCRRGPAALKATQALPSSPGGCTSPCAKRIPTY